MGVSASDFSVTDPASASVGGGLDCLDSSFGVVSCATGPVTWVQYWPNKPLTAGENYTMTVNGASAGVVGTPDGVPVASTQGVVRAQTVFGETDYPVKYGWGTVNNASALGGSYVQEQYPQASEKYSFTGSSLDLVMWAGPDRGTAKILITSPGHPKVKQTINTYAAAPGDLTFSWPALVAGKHTVTITATGANIAPSTNTWVAVDAITVDGSTTMTPKGTARWSDGPGYGYAFTGQKGASVTLRFYGTGVTWNALFGPNDGKATVTVDGVVYGTYDLYAAGYSFQDIPIAGVTLNPTFHILKITVAGTKQAASSGTIITLHQLTVL
jgi:hypothetical protein